MLCFFFFFSSRRRHTRLTCDWSSDVCSSDLRSSAKQLAHSVCAARRDVIFRYFFRRRPLEGIHYRRADHIDQILAVEANLVRAVDLIKDCTCAFKRIKSFKLVRLVTAFPNALQSSLW